MSEQGWKNYMENGAGPHEEVRETYQGMSDYLRHGMTGLSTRSRDEDPARVAARSRAYHDPAVVAAREAYRAAKDEWFKTTDEKFWRNNVMDLQAAEDAAFRAASKREMEEAGVWLKQPEQPESAQFWHEEIVSAEADADPKVRTLRAAISVAPSGTPEERRTYGRLSIALETAHAQAYRRANSARVGAERRDGTVLTPDARRWLSGLVELNGAEAVCAKLQVSPEIVRRLIKGVPTPPTWREVPPEVASPA